MDRRLSVGEERNQIVPLGESVPRSPKHHRAFSLDNPFDSSASLTRISSDRIPPFRIGKELRAVSENSLREHLLFAFPFPAENYVIEYLCFPTSSCRCGTA